MSLLITSNTALASEGSNSIGLNTPSSYVNNLNGVLTIPPNSEIAVQSVKINKTGNITIPEGGLNFGFYFGRGFNYDTSNDYFNHIFSFLPDIAEGLVTTARYKLWQRAVTDLSTAQLRPETGATINSGEIIWIEDTMWDKLGDEEPVREAKREARLRAHIGNKTVAGKAYDRLVVEMEAGDQDQTNKKVYAAMQRIASDRELSERTKWQQAH